jgi:hypothetical protein
MGDLKDEISPDLADRLAGELASAWRAFPTDRFTSDIGAALAPLALMARVDLLADRLTDALPTDFETAANVLWTSLDSPHIQVNGQVLGGVDLDVIDSTTTKP